jgi:ABC-type branched-subunit amino acid transport system ATPase component
MTALLETQHVTQRFGGLIANRDISTHWPTKIAA